MFKFTRVFFISVFLWGQVSSFAKDKLLVIINPNAGKGKAEDIYNKSVKSVLAEHYDLEVYMPKKGKQAYQYIKNHKSLLKFKGIVGIGGDGTQNKIFSALYDSPHGAKALEQVAVGVIPAGSGNALAKSIFHAGNNKEEAYNIEAMVSRVVEGKTSPLELWSYTTDRSEEGLSFLGLSMGIISEIDIGSEWLRPILGHCRFDFYGLFKWIALKSYPAKLRIVTEENKEMILESRFRQIWALSISHGSEDVAVAPQAKLNDNFLHVLYVERKHASRGGMFKFLTKLKKDFLDLPFVKVVRAKELKLELKKNDKVTIDGDLLEDNTRMVHLTPLPAKARVFSFVSS